MTITIDKSLQHDLYSDENRNPIPITWDQADALMRGETIEVDGKEYTDDDGPFLPGGAELDK